MNTGEPIRAGAWRGPAAALASRACCLLLPPLLLPLVAAAPAWAADGAVLLAQNALPSPPQAAAPNPAPSAQSSPPLAASGWFSGVRLGVQVDGGISGNPDDPRTGGNFGQIFTDHANQAQLNQILLTAQRATDPKATGYDVGFKLQLMYGSDARYTHFLGELDQTIGERYQLDVMEANLSAHLPWLTPGGVDAKAGQYPSPLGYENIDPSTNPFYSHSYISQFGTPFKHTGILTTTHVSPTLDLWLGLDSGEQTGLGRGDENGAPAGIAGFGLNSLFGGTLNLLVLLHLGPEEPTIAVPHADRYMRYENDAVLSYKPSDTLSFTTEAFYLRDEYTHDDVYGASQYVAYKLGKTLTLNGRAEVFRDNKGAFVAAYPNNLDYVDFERGFPSTTISVPGTTYSELTAGVTYQPSLPSVPTLMIRPEIRYDRSLSGTTPFNDRHDKGNVTLAADAVIGF